MFCLGISLFFKNISEKFSERICSICVTHWLVCATGCPVCQIHSGCSSASAHLDYLGSLSQVLAGPAFSSGGPRLSPWAVGQGGSYHTCKACRDRCTPSPRQPHHCVSLPLSDFNRWFPTCCSLNNGHCCSWAEPRSSQTVGQDP